MDIEGRKPCSPPFSMPSSTWSKVRKVKKKKKISSFVWRAEESSSPDCDLLTDRSEELIVSCWDEQKVSEWLEEIGLEKYDCIFDEHAIDGPALLELNSQDLRTLVDVEDFIKIVWEIETLLFEQREEIATWNHTQVLQWFKRKNLDCPSYFREETFLGKDLLLFDPHRHRVSRRLCIELKLLQKETLNIKIDAAQMRCNPPEIYVFAKFPGDKEFRTLQLTYSENYRTFSEKIRRRFGSLYAIKYLESKGDLKLIESDSDLQKVMRFSRRGPTRLLLCPLSTNTS
jgi:hypothetical protein